MDNNTKQRLILIAAVLATAITFYYIASPYQNCLRSESGNPVKEGKCRYETAW
jgi:hypothetical protein